MKLYSIAQSRCLSEGIFHQMRRVQAIGSGPGGGGRRSGRFHASFWACGRGHNRNFLGRRTSSFSETLDCVLAALQHVQEEE